MNRIDTFSPTGAGQQFGYVGNNGQFVAGDVPDGRRAAVRTTEGANQSAIRQLLEPASVDFTKRLISDNVSGLPGPARVQGRGTVADDIFNRNFSLMQPAIEKANSRLLTNLQARGLPVGSDAFNDAYGAQTQQTNEAISRLAQDANIQAGQEQSRLFGMEQAQRQSAISELAALMGGGFQPSSAAPSASVPGLNLSGLVGQQYQAEAQQAAQQANNRNSLYGAIGNIGSAAVLAKFAPAALLSTREAKEVLGQVDLDGAAAAILQMPLAAWRYKDGMAPEGDDGDPHIGPMAEDFQATTGIGDGVTISMVDYLGLLIAGLQGALVRIHDLEQMLFEEEDPLDATPVRVH